MMKRLINFSTISLTLLLLSTSGVKALENPVTTEASRSTVNKILVAQAEKDSQFVTVDPGHETQGELSIIEEGGKQYIEFGNDFQTGKGPDVEIILHRNKSIPLNIKEENYITIAPIKSFTGVQRYEVPAGIDLGDYGSLGIWCKEFNITFAYAQL